MDVRHNRVLAIGLAVVGPLLALTSILTSSVPGIVAGAVLTLLGVLTIVNPMLRITSSEVQVRNPLGMTLKRFPVNSPADLRFDGKKLRHVDGDRKIMTLGFGVHPADAQALRQQVAGG